MHKAAIDNKIKKIDEVGIGNSLVEGIDEFEKHVEDEARMLIRMDNKKTWVSPYRYRGLRHP